MGKIDDDRRAVVLEMCAVLAASAWTPVHYAAALAAMTATYLDNNWTRVTQHLRVSKCIDEWSPAAELDFAEFATHMMTASGNAISNYCAGPDLAEGDWRAEALEEARRHAKITDRRN